MNEYASGFILGLVQGLTEFLPVSSSGHLVLLEKMGVGEESLTMNLLLHLATLLAVIVCYRKKIFSLLKHPLGEEMRFLLVASVPTAVFAGAIRYFLPDTSDFLPFFFMVTTVVLLLPKIVKPKEREIVCKPYGKAIFVGVMQGVACFNGVSRSGSTVTAMRLCGYSAEKSAETSFLLSVPIIIASAAVECLTNKSGLKFSGGAILGMVTAFVVGIGAIKLFVSVLKKDKTAYFSIYTFALSVLSFFLLFPKK